MRRYRPVTPLDRECQRRGARRGRTRPAGSAKKAKMGSVMNPRPEVSALEALLGDSLVQLAMRADHVEPRAAEIAARRRRPQDRRPGAPHAAPRRLPSFGETRRGRAIAASRRAGDRTMVKFLHPASDLRVGDRHHHGARRLDLLFPAAGFAVPRHHAAAGGRQRQLSRRQRAGRRRYGDDAARAADQRRAGHDLHVLVELERRLVDHHRHLRCRLSARYRRGRRAEPRLAGGLVAAGDRQSGRRDDPQAEPEFRPDRQSHFARRLGRSGRAVATTPICRSSIR